MGLFTFLKSLFSSKEFVTDGAPKFEVPTTKEIKFVSESTPNKVKAKKTVKTSAKPKKPKATKKKSD